MKHDPVASLLVQLGLAAAGDTPARLRSYADLVRDRAAPLGFVASRDAAGVLERHVLDSVRAAPLVAPAASVVDLGSGAGLPGIPVAIVRPDVRVTLADSQRRRVAFLELARDEIPVSNAHPVHARVQDLEGPFDAALARAFAPLSEAWTAAVPLLGSGGSLVYFAGASADVGGQIAGLSPSPASVRTVAAPSLLASAGPLVIMAVQ